MLITKIVGYSSIGNFTEVVEVGKRLFVKFELSEVIREVDDAARSHSRRENT